LDNLGVTASGRANRYIFLPCKKDATFIANTKIIIGIILKLKNLKLLK